MLARPADIDRTALTACGEMLLRHPDRLRASLVPVSFEGWTAEQQLAALRLRGARHLGASVSLAPWS